MLRRSAVVVPQPVVLRSLRKSLSIALLVALVWPIGAIAQSQALTLPRNLTQLIDESDVVVQGRVISVSLAAHPQLANLQTVVVTLQVEDTVKGALGHVFTFRQAVIDRRDLQQLMGYRTGQHLLLVLIRPSVYGLSSPAGLQQGRFTISSLGGGKLQAANGMGNAGLLRGVDSTLQTSRTTVSPQVQALLREPKPGPLPLDELKSLMRAIATRNPPR